MSAYHSWGSPAAFRRAIIRELKDGKDSFDLDRLQRVYGASNKVVQSATKELFLSQCLRATEDAQITSDEQRILRQLGIKLQLSTEQQEKCLTAAANGVFSSMLQEARADGLISDVEASALADLRKDLGLPTMDANEFGPKKPPRKKRKRKKRKQEQSTEHGTASPVLGVPYAILLGPLVASLVIAIAIIFMQHWNSPRQIFAALLIATCLGLALTPPIILYQFCKLRCWECGANWSVRQVPSSRWEGEYGFFSLVAQEPDGHWEAYECAECGSVKEKFVRDRHR